MTTKEFLFVILRSEVNEELINADECQSYDPNALYKLAKAHDLMYCVTSALEKSGLLPKEKQYLDLYTKDQILAAARTIRIEDALARIKKILSEAQIQFVPLKGALLRYLYPDKLMRASCDIDVLIKEENLGQAISALVSYGFTSEEQKNYHDISLYYGTVHLELHFNICENMQDIDALLNRVWEFVEPVSEYEFHEKPEFFVYHHIAHMKYHFVNGGCGIRPFLDLYVMKKVAFYNENKLIDLLDSVGLTSFYKAILSVVSVWFEGQPATDLTQKCEEYILRGGVYGSEENNMAAQSSIRRGRLSYAWHSIFLPYTSMRILYPKLGKLKFLLPFYYIVRLFEKAFMKSGKKSRDRLKHILKQNQTNIDSVSELLIAMGIKDRSSL